MFSKETKDKVIEAVSVEYESACDKFGFCYNSKHEAYAVLKEEIEEVKENTDKFKNLMHILWKSVRGLPIPEVKHYSDKRHVQLMKENAINLAMEAIQVAAVCNKIEASIDNKAI